MDLRSKLCKSIGLMRRQLRENLMMEHYSKMRASIKRGVLKMEIDFEGELRSLAQIFRTLMRRLHALT